MTWGIIFFIIGIGTAVMGVWNLAQRRHMFLSIAGFIWFLITLFRFIIPKTGIYDFVILPGVSIGNLLLFIVVPGLIIFAFFQRGTRS